MGEGKGQWKGVERLATDARSCVAMNATIRTIQQEKKMIEDLLRERLEPLLEALVQCKDKALLAIPSAIGLTQDDLQEIADVASKELATWR